MSEKHHEQPIIVIKKIVKKNVHHGGSWKIAYADFVTAMMAFFLLMWLLSMLNKYQLMGISNYFSKPLKEVFVNNKKNDTKTPKIPDENTRKYKLQLIDKEKAPIDPHSIKKGEGEKNTRTEKNTESKQSKKQDSQDKLHFTDLKKQLETDLNRDPQVKRYAEQLNFEIVKDGLKITLHDLENKPMFSLGKTDFEAYAGPILQWLSAKINQSGHKATIIGHTDTNAYANGLNYSNWELSADRANATRRVLIKYGMNSNDVIRIQGAGDLVLLDKKMGENPVNRRIEIILLSDQALKRLLEG